jgi:hypothetical protein
MILLRRNPLLLVNLRPETRDNLQNGEAFSHNVCHREFIDEFQRVRFHLRLTIKRRFAVSTFSFFTI